MFAFWIAIAAVFMALIPVFVSQAKKSKRQKNSPVVEFNSGDALELTLNQDFRL